MILEGGEIKKRYFLRAAEAFDRFVSASPTAGAGLFPEHQSVFPPPAATFVLLVLFATQFEKERAKQNVFCSLKYILSFNSYCNIEQRRLSPRINSRPQPLSQHICLVVGSQLRHF